MKIITVYVEKLIALCGITGDAVPYISHASMVVVAVILSFLAGLLCRRLLVPLVLRLTARTEVRWDDVIFNEQVLLSACRIVPAIVIWVLLPMTFFEFPAVREALARLTAIYITVMTVRTTIVLIDSLKLLENGKRTARQQYLYSFCGVLKILMIFIAAIVVIAIAFGKDPSTLFAGLGAASAILMLAFQDTIKGLVAGIRLTSNDMLHIGDWITVPSAGANGTVEEITLTMVKVRNFDNTIVTVTPQTLVDGSFQNWLGMQQREGRKQSRRLYFDFRSILAEDSTTNITRYRHHIEDWLKQNPAVLTDKTVLVRQAEATQGGCCLEFTFWLQAQDALTYEHQTSDIMEYIMAAANDFGLRIYQQFPEQ
ncbi:MAG: mechanosensitive ion channel [Prevotella sp.]|nr:mechanosensitive ion channel [Prevotella sp.]MBQ8487970.1 mechanosensitive ion channel [Prevotella sp.]